MLRAGQSAKGVGFPAGGNRRIVGQANGQPDFDAGLRIGHLLRGGFAGQQVRGERREIAAQRSRRADARDHDRGFRHDKMILRVNRTRPPLNVANASLTSSTSVAPHGNRQAKQPGGRRESRAARPGKGRQRLRTNQARDEFRSGRSEPSSRKRPQA